MGPYLKVGSIIEKTWIVVRLELTETELRLIRMCVGKMSGQDVREALGNSATPLGVANNVYDLYRALAAAEKQVKQT